MEKTKPFISFPPACCCVEPKMWKNHSFTTADMDLAATTPFIGSIDRLCAAFWHVRPCFELQATSAICIRRGDGVCLKNSVVCVCRLIVDDETFYIGRYTNCFQGHTEKNIHAEQFLVRDSNLINTLIRMYDKHSLQSKLRERLKSKSKLEEDDDCSDVDVKDAAASKAARMKLILYLTYQPCHHSGGGRALQVGTQHNTSCSELLCHWKKTVLDKYNVELVIKCSDLYRAAWTNPKFSNNEFDANVFMPRGESARAGIRLLKDNGVVLSGFDSADWAFVLDKLILPEERDRISPILIEDRTKHDEKVTAFLAQI